MFHKEVCVVVLSLFISCFSLLFVTLYLCLSQVAEYHIKRCLEAGLCSHSGQGSKDDDTETEDQRRMEMS